MIKSIRISQHRVLLLGIMAIVMTLCLASLAHAQQSSQTSCPDPKTSDYTCPIGSKSQDANKTCVRGTKCGPEKASTCVLKDGKAECQLGGTPPNFADEFADRMKCLTSPDDPSCTKGDKLPTKPPVSVPDNTTQQASDCAKNPTAAGCKSESDLPQAPAQEDTNICDSDPRACRSSLSELCQSGDNASCNKLSSFNKLNKLITPQTGSLGSGNRGPSVKMVQQFLNSHGYTLTDKSGQAGSAGYETNYYGNLTKSAVMEFQAAHGLIPDGIVGPQTLAVMNNIISAGW